MRRLAVLASVLVVLAGVVAYARVATQVPRAQDATPAGGRERTRPWPTIRSSAPGGGRTSRPAAESFISYGIFHADGTYVEVGLDNLTSIGAWRATASAPLTWRSISQISTRSPAIVVLGEADGSRRGGRDGERDHLARQLRGAGGRRDRRVRR